jgi:Mce-associated membrane protein
MSTILKRTKAAAAKTAKKKSGPETDPDTTEPEATDPDDTATEPDEPTAAADTEDDTEESDADTEDEDETEGEEDGLEEEDGEDGDEEFDFEDDDLDDGTPAPRGRSRSARQVLVVLALVALVLSGAVFYLLTRVNEARAADEAGDEAVSAARAHAQDLLSYDYRTLDSDFARGLAATTGGFHSQYQQTTTQLVRPQAAQQRIIVQAAVMNAGLVSADSDNAVVLLFVDRVTTKSGQQKPAFDQDRVRMSMTKVNGKWLVSKLDAL